VNKILSFCLDDLFALAQAFSSQEGTCFFYSSGHDELAQNSLLFLFPFEKVTQKAGPGCWEYLTHKITVTLDIEWAGFIGYEMGGFADSDKILPLSSSLPFDCCFYRYACVLKFDHRTKELEVYLNEHHIDTAYLNLQWLKAKPLSFRDFILEVSEVSDSVSSYLQKIALAKEWIRDGEIYQINLSQQFWFKGAYDSFSLFSQLVNANPSPFSAFLNCGEFCIISSSPERLLCCRQGILETRPIKGTVPRGKTVLEDQENLSFLKHSEKEKAELLMITDLMRSDLGKIASYGTIETQEIWRCESYASVHHLVSVIQAKIRKEIHPLEALRSVFPGGSITGCPKLRAMEAIIALEGRPRGVYTGSIGYLGPSGDFDFNIAIRTLTAYPDRLNLSLGGGIVIDSDPVREYEETLHKGAAFFKLLKIKEFI
jgi:para-aminobenzoate synthetase component I